MNRLAAQLLISVSSALLANSALAQSPANDQADVARYRQAQQLSRAVKLLREPEFRRHQKELCTGLLKNFRSGANTTVVEPVLRTNDPRNPQFTKLQESCPAVPLLEAYDKNHNFYRTIQGLPTEKRRSQITWHSSAMEGRPPFALYETELNRNRADGPELLLFAQSFFWPTKIAGALDPSKIRVPPHLRYGGYKILALRDCDLTGIMEVTNPERPGQDPLHGVISIEGRGYVYTFTSAACEGFGDVRSLGFHSFAAGNYLEPVCLFANEVSLAMRSDPNARTASCIGNL
jgi:hypothetical protein